MHSTPTRRGGGGWPRLAALLLVPATLLPDRALAAPAAPQLFEPEALLVIQFEPPAKVRATAGGLTSLAGAELAELNALAEAAGVVFGPLLELTEQAASALEQRALQWSGLPQPDLLGQVVAHAGAEADLSALAAAFSGSPLIARASVEHRRVVPPGFLPGDLAPPTADFTPAQTYLGPEVGVDAAALHALGVTGSGVRVSDVEYGWIETHEDLADAALEPEAGIVPPGFVGLLGYDEHGTAVVGLLGAPWNGYGIDGLAPDSAFGLYPEQDAVGGDRRVDAILSALSDSLPGDVILLEMQSLGPDGKLGPAELDPSVHTATRLATDSGVVVVAAAGNGGANLDAPAYAAYGALGDSGAILVGAGTTDAVHATEPFSTYGERVDLQSWGSAAVTLGYGDYAKFASGKNQTYTEFGGTSTAAALVAGGVALLQSYALEVFGSPLAPAQLRELLVSSGAPPGPGAPIGPALDLGAALERFHAPWLDLGLGTPGLLGPSALDGVSLGGPGDPYVLRIENGFQGSSVTLTVGSSRIDLPLLGCVLVPSPDKLVYPGTIGPDLSVQFQSVLNPNLQPGTSLFLQAFFADPGGPQLVACTNALQFVAP